MRRWRPLFMTWWRRWRRWRRLSSRSEVSACTWYVRCVWCVWCVYVPLVRLCKWNSFPPFTPKEAPSFRTLSLSTAIVTFDPALGIVQSWNSYFLDFFQVPFSLFRNFFASLAVWAVILSINLRLEYSISHFLSILLLSTRPQTCKTLFIFLNFFRLLAMRKRSGRTLWVTHYPPSPRKTNWERENERRGSCALWNGFIIILEIFYWEGKIEQCCRVCWSWTNRCAYLFHNVCALYKLKQTHVHIHGEAYFAFSHLFGQRDASSTVIRMHIRFYMDIPNQVIFQSLL